MTSSPGGSTAVSHTNGGKIYAFNNISNQIPTLVVAANPNRQRLTFHNPGTGTVFVAPTMQQNTGLDVALIPGPGALGGCFLLQAGGTLVLQGECQGAWQAFAAAGGLSPLTVMESNV